MRLKINQNLVNQIIQSHRRKETLMYAFQLYQ